MKSSFLFDKTNFEAFTLEHYIPLFFVFLLGCFLIFFAKNNLNETNQRKLIFLLSIIPLLGCLMTPAFSIIEGDFTIKEDLPFHICRVLALTVPIIILKNNRFWLGIIYFWIIAGTLNANITPDIDYGFPHWTYFSYWMLHSFLVIIPLYYVFVFNLKITRKDLWNAFWTANIFLVISLLINLSLDSNYMYSRHKPPVASIMDLMGPWPIYLISGQMLALVLFIIIYLPFEIKRSRS